MAVAKEGEQSYRAVPAPEGVPGSRGPQCAGALREEGASALLRVPRVHTTVKRFSGSAQSWKSSRVDSNRLFGCICVRGPPAATLPRWHRFGAQAFRPFSFNYSQKQQTHLNRVSHFVVRSAPNIWRIDSFHSAHVLLPGSGVSALAYRDLLSIVQKKAHRLSILLKVQANCGTLRNLAHRAPTRLPLVDRFGLEMGSAWWNMSLHH
jgi:hypothetical protein